MRHPAFALRLWSLAFVAEHGRAGRSWGCPAVDPAVAGALIDALSDGGALLLWHPDG